MERIETDIAANPYHPPAVPSVKAEANSHPAGPLIWLLSTIYVLIGAVHALPSRPPQQALMLRVSAGFVLFGLLGMALAWRRFDSVSRWLTVGWSGSASLILFYVLIFVDPPSLPLASRDIPGLILVGVYLLMLFAAAHLACAKKPSRQMKQACQTDESW